MRLSKKQQKQQKLVHHHLNHQKEKKEYKKTSKKTGSSTTYKSYADLLKADPISGNKVRAATLQKAISKALANPTDPDAIKAMQDYVANIATKIQLKTVALSANAGYCWYCKPK